MWIVQKIRKKGFDSTIPSEFRQGRFRGSTNLVFRVRSRLGGRGWLGVLDTWANISIVAKKTLPRGDLKNLRPTTAIRMGDGHLAHSCVHCEVDVHMGTRSIVHQFYVMDTEAFDFVLGTDFFAEHPQILYLTLQAP